MREFPNAAEDIKRLEIVCKTEFKLERKIEEDKKKKEKFEQDQQKLKDRMGKERKREGRIKMMRSEKPLIKRKEVVKEEDPDTKAFKKYVGDLD